MGWKPEDVERGTKCFGPETNGYPGGYPKGFLKWIRDLGYWGDVRLHVPCGMVADSDPGEVVRVDVKMPPETNATHSFDATDMKAWPDEWKEYFDLVLIDKPYTEALAESLYDTKDVYAGLDKWVACAKYSVKPGGLLATLDYQVPKRPGEDWNLIACWGIYVAMSVRHMMCFQVWQKDGADCIDRGLMRWTE